LSSELLVFVAETSETLIEIGKIKTPQSNQNLAENELRGDVARF